MKNALLNVVASLAFASLASAQLVVERWTFDSPSDGTGVNGTVISTWDATAADNSDLGGGVLRFGNSTTSDYTNGQLLPDIDTSTIDTMTWTFELADLKISSGSHFRFTTITSGTGVPEIELTSFGGASPFTFSPDMEYNVNTDKLDAASGITLSGPGGTLGSALTIVATWDFANNTMSLDMGGGNIATITPTANMADSIGTITGFQIRSQSFVAGDYVDIDSFTIETATVPEPSVVALMSGLAAFCYVALRRRRA